MGTASEEAAAVVAAASAPAVAAVAAVSPALAAPSIPRGNLTNKFPPRSDHHSDSKMCCVHSVCTSPELSCAAAADSSRSRQLLKAQDFNHEPAQPEQRAETQRFVFCALLSSDHRSQQSPAAKKSFVVKANAGSHYFSPCELKKIAVETRTFTRDGFADNAGAFNPAFNDDACFLPDIPYECTDQRGHHAWLNPPIQCIKPALQHYLHCKARDPNTSICILVPYWRRATYWPLLKGMKLLRNYSKGSQIFFHKNQNGSTAELLCPWSVAIFYDPPQPPAHLGSVGAEHAMTFPGSVAGHDTNVLLDTGATHSFVSRTFLQTAGLKPLSLMTSVKVTMANCDQVATQERCNVQLRIQGKLFVVCSYILPLPAHIGIILGQDWHLQYKVLTDWGNMTCTIQYKNRRFVFSRKGYTEVQEDQPNLHYLQKVDDEDYDPGESDPQDWDRIPSEYRPLIEEFREIFPKDLPAGLPLVRAHVDHVIPTECETPPKPGGRQKYSLAEMKEIQEQIDALRHKGFIQPSASPWGASIIFAPKKNGQLRMCFDYRILNNVTRKDRYTLPRVDELLGHLHCAKVFSGIDLASGYHQVRISEADIPKTAFRSPFGAFEFKIMCFGLTNAPATFQRVMNEVFKDYIGMFILIYLDDILVYSKTPEEHKVHLRIVLELLIKHRLYGRLAKSDFGKSQMPFLGHVVGAEGISVDPDKTAVIQQWGIPDSIREVQSFLGFANWFRIYIPGYSQKIAPLTKLTQKNVPFIWSPECQSCFDWLKACLQQPPVLALPDFDQQFEVRADASSSGVGAVLMQGGRPLAYESAAFALAERSYTIGEQELLAVVFALKKWRSYLEGAIHPVRIVTDHMPLTYLPTKGILGPRQVRWSEHLSRFHLEWVHTAGKNNVADILSRMPCMTAFVMTRAKAQSQTQVQSQEPSPIPPKSSLAAHS